MSDAPARAADLESSLRQLCEAVDALRQGLVDSRFAFVRARASDLEERHGDNARHAARVHALETEVAGRRGALCEVLRLPPTSRMSTIMGRLPADAARRLGETAERLRGALRALRVEGAVGQRLLDVSRRAHEGLLHQLATDNRRQGQRYDRHARSVRSEAAGGFVRGTV
ncbi:MAG: hypothetical protein R3F56_23005 [Planctomycetota bacterium]